MRFISFALAALMCAALTGCTRDPAVTTRSEQEHEHTPDGIVESPEALAAKADILIYPESKLPEGESNVRTDGKQTRYEIVMLTPDSVQQVEEYYWREAKLEAISADKGRRLLGLTPKGHYAKVEIIAEDKGTRIVAVTVQDSPAPSESGSIDGG
jgi:hypothetical protein